MATKQGHLTYKQVIEILRQFSEDHSQINYFGTGDIQDITENPEFNYTNYPVMFVVDDGVDYDTNQLTYNIDVLFLDISHESNGQKHWVDIKSDMLNCHIDLMAELEVKPMLFGEDVIMTTSYGQSDFITKETIDNLSGVTTPVSIGQPIALNRCAIPKN